MSVDVDLVWGTLRTRENMLLVVGLSTLRVRTLKILERSYVLGDERFVKEDGSRGDYEENLEVLACI